jgi:tetratricopeptide (TPR) repeat protein/class 3 adenylate cyclase
MLMNGYQAAQHADDLTQELNEARKIQMGMLPQEAPEIPGFQIAAHSAPAVAVGGDFYDFIPLGDDRLGIVIGDAVGHGIAAALLMTMTLTDFRSLAPRDISPAVVLNGVNRRLTQSMRTRAFVTSIYAVLDLTSNRLTCAMAGMQPWLIKAESQECVPIEPSGARFPLGASGKSQYQSCDVEMEMGDALVLYTDGIPEAVNEDDELYSFERLESALVENSGSDAQEILDAILADVRRFAGDCPQEDDITMVVLKATESFVAAPVVPARRLIAGERKSVTTLFAVADGELSTELIGQAKALVREHGGMADAMGDDTLAAFFGVPILHEDDAERAITAAQAIQGLQTFRMGINTGTAIIRADEDIDYSQMGEAMHRALHLANAAQPGQILASESAHRLTYGAFQFEAVTRIQPFEDEAISAYPVLAPAEEPHRVRGIKGLYAPLIGREREMEQLTACIDELLDGRGGIVSITGEAGIGKTRLVAELRKHATPSVRWLEGRCISYGQAMNYGPFRGIISTYMGILPTDTEEEMKAKLHKQVNALLPAEHRWIPINVGSIFFPQYEQELRVASGDDVAKQVTYPILRNLFHKIAEEKPLVMVFEDLHWADPTSLAVLEFLMESVDEASILYVWVYRPYRDSGCWRLRERADREFGYCNTEIDLSALRSQETDTLVSELLRIPDIPERMRTLVQDKASGNPLYVEEIIRSFVDGEAVVRDAEYWRATVESADIIPSDTLQGVILARVDGLDPDVKEILQIASVVGNDFPLALLEQVVESAERLSSSLRELERAEMLQRRRVGRDWEYHFRHPLIHDVVYHSLLPEDRSALHEKTGEAIESLYPEKLDDYTDLLAHHYGYSENIDKALHYLTLAGDKARELASYWEALDHYDTAMEKAEGLPDDLHRKQVVVDLVMKRSGARHWLGVLRPDVEELEKYLEWAEALGDRHRIQFFYQFLSAHCSFIGETAQAEQYIERLASVGQTDVANWFRTQCYISKANYEEAALLAQELVEAFTKASDMFWLAFSLGRLAGAYRMMEQWRRAIEAGQATLDMGIESSYSTHIMFGHVGLGSVYLSMGEWEKAIEECETALNISPSGVFIPSVVTPLGDAYCKAGQPDRGIALLEHWKAHAKRTGRGPIVESGYCLPLAQGYLTQGDRDKARANADEALEIAVAKGYPLHEAQAHRISGDILASTDFPAAEDHFSRSLEIMQRIKARNEEGVTELSWGRTCKQHGDVDQARVHLARAAGIFEALGTTRYLQWTREALDF